MVASHFDRTTFCWLPPDSVLTGWSKLRNFRRRRLRCGSTRPSSLRAHDQPGHRRLADHRQGRVGEDGEVHDQALAEPVLRHVGDAGRHRGRRLGEGDLRPRRRRCARRSAGRCRTGRARPPCVRCRPARPARGSRPARTANEMSSNAPSRRQAGDLEDRVARRRLPCAGRRRSAAARSSSARRDRGRARRAGCTPIRWPSRSTAMRSATR